MSHLLHHTSDLQPANDSSPMISWVPGTPIPKPSPAPFEQYEIYLDSPPDGFEVKDIELVWWLVCARNSKHNLSEKLKSVIATHALDKGWSCFVYVPIADLDGTSRYPDQLVSMLFELLPEGVCSRLEDKGFPLRNGMVIQLEIWHELIKEALGLCPIAKLPPHLRDLRFSADLGL